MNQTEKLVEVQGRKKRIMQGPDETALQALHAKGKLSPMERIERLFDPGSFRELGLWTKPMKTGFDIDKADIPRDALIVGYGKVNGRIVYATSFDSTVVGGSQAAMHFAKIGRAMQQARDEGVPYVGIIDSGGRRIQDLFGRWSYRAPVRTPGCEEGAVDMFNPPMSSGVIPQISLLLGPSVAGTAYSPVMADFVFFRTGSHMALASPQLLKAVTFQDVTWDDIGGAKLHATTTGTCDVLVNTDEEALKKCRDLLGYLPSNWREKPPVFSKSDKPGRDESLISILPVDPSQAYDIHNIITRLVDDNSFFELQALYAPNVVIGFARLSGQVVGVVANNPMNNGGALDANGCDKEARFIRVCDCYSIPLVFLTDTPGFLPSVEGEQSREGLGRHAAKPLYAICESTVPKVGVVIKRCLGSGALVMGNRETGLDALFAWPGAEIRQRDLESLAKQVYADEITKAKDARSFIEDKLLGLEQEFKEPYNSGGLMAIDDIIDPAETRAVLMSILERLAKKLEPARPWKKHGIIPL